LLVTPKSKMTQLHKGAILKLTVLRSAAAARAYLEVGFRWRVDGRLLILVKYC
jgi:hypothetical protein